MGQDMLSIAQETNGAISYLRLAGRLDIFNAERFKNSLATYYPAGSKYILLDLKELQYIDSTGIGVLLYAWKNMLGGVGKILCFNASDMVKTVIDLTKLTAIIQTRATADEAFAEAQSL